MDGVDESATTPAATIAFRAGVRSLSSETMTQVLWLTGFLYSVAGLAALQFALFAGRSLDHPTAVAAGSGAAVVAGVGVVIAQRRLSSETVFRIYPLMAYVYAFGAGLIITAMLLLAGPQFPIGASVYLISPIIAVYIFSRVVSSLFIATIATEYGFVLVVFRGREDSPLNQWVFFVALMAATAVVLGRFVERTDRLAVSEREARETLADVNRNLQSLVAEQVQDLDRLGRLRRFLSPQVADAVVLADDESLLNPHRRQVTVFFCDLRGFTAFATSSEPEDVMDALDAYYGIIGPLLGDLGGTVGTFAGDGIMAYFNDPLPCANPAAQAVELALRLREPLGRLVDSWQRRGFTLGYGIGIAYGYATLGMIGFEGRRDYTAVGPVVNLASRLCGEAAPGEVLIDQRTHDEVTGHVETERRDVSLKGYANSVEAFRLVGPRALGD